MRKYTSREYLTVMAKSVAAAPALYRHPYQSQQAIKYYQEHRIRLLVRHAYTTVPAYHRLYDQHNIHPDDVQSLADLSRLPLITKDQMIAAFPSDTFSQLTYQSASLVSVSSGSSGKVIRIVHAPDQTWPYVLGRARILNMTSCHYPWSKTLSIYTSPYPASSFFGMYPSRFISTLTPVADLSGALADYRPAILCCYPSVALDLMRYYRVQNSSPPSMGLIIVGSEMSSREQRATLSEFFHCPVLDEYSSEELGWIATECAYGTYHLWDDISYIEIINSATGEILPDGQLGEIVGTNLHNRIMPFIRYRQGDLGIIGAAARCRCGRTGRRLLQFEGRRNDTFRFANGVRFHSGYLLDTVYRLLLDTGVDIADFCFIQQNISHVCLQILPGPTWQKKNKQSVLALLRSVFPADVSLRVDVTQQLLKTRSGKRNPIISQLIAEKYQI